MTKKEDHGADRAMDGIDQIREIIFGEQMVEFRKQFDELKKKCQELSNKINGLEKKQSDCDHHMTEALAQQKSTQLSDQQQTRALIEQLKKEFDQKIAELDQVKVDRSQIGQAFIEWGMQVKQTATN